MNIFEAPRATSTPMASEYNDAVNASRFVKGFGVAVLAYSILMFLGINLLSSAIGIGTGLFIFRYDAGRFYRVLGVVVMVLALIAPLPFLSPAVLASSILVKGSQVLGVLNRSPREDADWDQTHLRTMVGLVTAGIGLLITVIVAIIVVAAIALIVGRNLR